MLEGPGCKVAKGVVKAVRKILGNFEEIIQIRVGGLPLISKHRKDADCELKPSIYNELGGVLQSEEVQPTSI